MIQKNSENHKKLLNKISQDYYKQNQRFFHMLHDNKPIQVCVNGKIHYTTVAWQLYQDMNTTMKESKQLVDSLSAIHVFCNESYLLLIKVIFYAAKLLEAYEKPLESFKAYVKALQFLVNYKDKIDYKNDLLFQQQLDGVFDVFNSMELSQQLKIKDGRGNLIKSIKRSLGILSTSYTNKCGESFVTVGNIYEDLLNMLVAVRGNTTQKIDKKGADFFNMAKKLQANYHALKERGELSTEHQVYYIELNQYLMNVTELIKQNSIILVNKIKTNNYFFYEANSEQMTDKRMDSYLDSWDSLKNTFIEPTFLLMKSLNMQEVNTNVLIGVTYGMALDHWLTIVTRSYALFKNWKEEWIKAHEVGDIVNVHNVQQTRSKIARLEKEIEYTSNKSHLIIKLAALCDSCVLCPAMRDNEDIIQFVNVYTDATNQLRQQLITQQEKELNDINENANALIHKENEEKEDKAEREKKIRKRHLYFKEKKDAKNNQKPKEATSSEKTLARPVPIIINKKSKNLEELEEIDETSILLVRSLKYKTEVSYEELQNLAKNDVSIPSDIQSAMYANINVTMIDYYHLVTLQEKHIALSQLSEIKQDEKLKVGIKASHIELKNTMRVIYENIQLLLGLFDEIIVRQEIKKDEQVYKWGLQKAREMGLKNLSYNKIMELGEGVFRKIGINKKRKNQDVSEYTKEKRFLNLIQLHFSGFLYLQQKIGPHLFNNYQEMQSQFSSFNAALPESCERFEGFLGLILKQQYDQYGDIAYLTEAFKHTADSFKQYQIKDMNTPALCEMAHRLAAIEDELASVNSLDPDLLKQALGHYQDALLYNLEAEELKMDLSAVEEVNQRISTLQELLRVSDSHTLMKG